MVIALVRAGRASKGGNVVDRHNNRGFTLIEVMVVVVILAILAAIALPSYANYVARSKIRTAQADELGDQMAALHDKVDAIMIAMAQLRR